MHTESLWCLSAQASSILQKASAALKCGEMKKTMKKKSAYFSSAEEKTVSSVEEEFVSLTSDEEIQNKKQDHLTQK